MKHNYLLVRVVVRYFALWLRHGKAKTLWIAGWRSRHVTSSSERVLSDRMARRTGKALLTEYFNGTVHRW